MIVKYIHSDFYKTLGVRTPKKIFYVLQLSGASFKPHGITGYIHISDQI